MLGRIPIVRCDHKACNRADFKIGLIHEIADGEYGLVAHVVVVLHALLARHLSGQLLAAHATANDRILVVGLHSATFAVLVHPAVEHRDRCSRGSLDGFNRFPIGVVGVVGVCIALRRVVVFHLEGLDGDLDVDSACIGRAFILVLLVTRVVHRDGLFRLAHGVAVRIGAVCHLKGVVLRASAAYREHERLEQFAIIIAFLVHVVFVHVDKVDVRVKFATLCVRFLVHCAYLHSSVLFCRREPVHDKAFARAINRTACARSARIRCAIRAAVPCFAVVHSRRLAATQLVQLDFKLFRRNRADCKFSHNHIVDKLAFIDYIVAACRLCKRKFERYFLAFTNVLVFIFAFKCEETVFTVRAVV